jgi:hypothetical protein
MSLRRFGILFVVFGGCLTSPVITQASVILTLDPPAGSIGGLQGDTVGWGFTLSSSTDFTVVTSSNFCVGASGITNACQASAIGSYSDYIAMNFTIAGPAPEGPVITQAFSASAETGVGAFTVDGSVIKGQMDSGQIVLTYDLYSVDPLAPNFDPTVDLIATGNYLSAPASITVGLVSPEPCYSLPIWLLACGLATRACAPISIRRARNRERRKQMEAGTT